MIVSKYCVLPGASMWFAPGYAGFWVSSANIVAFNSEQPPTWLRATPPHF